MANHFPRRNVAAEANREEVGGSARGVESKIVVSSFGIGECQEFSRRRNYSRTEFFRSINRWGAKSLCSLKNGFFKTAGGVFDKI